LGPRLVSTTWPWSGLWVSRPLFLLVWHVNHLSCDQRARGRARSNMTTVFCRWPRTLQLRTHSAPMRCRPRVSWLPITRSYPDQEGFSDEFVNFSNDDHGPNEHVGLTVRARERAGLCSRSRMAAGCLLLRRHRGCL